MAGTQKLKSDDVGRVFRRLQRAYSKQQSQKTGLVCKAGLYRGCAVLKLQKASWNNDENLGGPSECGIFFSIWLNRTDLAAGRANYNIHALKLRELKRYSLTSIAFARDFRKFFRSSQHRWPNVSLDFGPQTLMQGWMEIRLGKFQRDVLTLLKGFTSVSRIIERLLISNSHH